MERDETMRRQYTKDAGRVGIENLLSKRRMIEPR